MIQIRSEEHSFCSQLFGQSHLHDPNQLTTSGLATQFLHMPRMVEGWNYLEKEH